jgi:putative transposase
MFVTLRGEPYMLWRAVDPKRTQKFLSCFGPIRQHFALKRHLLRASLYRKQLAARFVACREFAELAQNPLTAF